MNNPLLRVRDLCVAFGTNPAVRGVNFDLFAGETVGLVGESGSGKSTLARAILRLLQPVRGSVEFLGLDLLKCSGAALRAQRRNLQIVFQDPLASLNPRMTVGEAIGEPLQIFEPGLTPSVRLAQVSAMLERVGLDVSMADRYPHEFSGGQCQRVGIARAMILSPKLLICDEVVSSLDVSIQGQIVNLLADLQREAGMAVLFISHNLAVVRHLSHRVLVIYLGKLVEIAPCDALFASPVHPYTRALLAAVAHLPSKPVAAAPAVAGVPALVAEPIPPARLMASGCAYRDRCPYVLPICETSDPPLIEVSAGHWVACHRSHETLIPLSFAP
ncbi:MAG: ATP-binding cassette domain-containing protein [Pseudomonadota bacterium]|nr:ATP-binding cassette domain-containing protein [Pseudomonadota bacterium]